MMRMKKDTEKLKKTLAALPSVAGVYLMKGVTGDVIYVGKAANLRTRVRSYFSRRQDLPKIEALKTKIYDVEYIATPTEVEALLLEATLVAEYDPRYNTLLKDGKSYPLLKITKEDYPRIAITRDKRDTRARYYGPYTDARLLRQALGLINSIFPIRKCRRLPKRPCLYYFLKQCLGPCVNPSVCAEYARNIKEIEEFLGGNKKSFIDYLTARMQQASARYNYEEAARCKEQIRALATIRLKRFRHYDPTRMISLSGSIELKQVLGLKKVPQRLVCFDVSNTAGTAAVAAKVSFFREVPAQNEYRRFKIRMVNGIDDYRMIQEALLRTIRALKEKREMNVPDLIIIDGGKGHLQSAYSVLEAEGYTHIPLIALAKKFEQVYSLPAGQPVPLVEGGLAHNLLRRIRDEAHRFAVSYHRTLRGRSVDLSVLDSIEGIGPVRKKNLLAHFPSIEAIRGAPIEKIAGLPGFNRLIAQKIIAALKRG
jgi:excinuclease ABC subunit C